MSNDVGKTCSNKTKNTCVIVMGFIQDDLSISLMCTCRNILYLFSLNIKHTFLDICYLHPDAPTERNCARNKALIRFPPRPDKTNSNAVAKKP